jgi:hypothetical protein
MNAAKIPREPSLVSTFGRAARAVVREFLVHRERFAGGVPLGGRVFFGRYRLKPSVVTATLGKLQAARIIDVTVYRPDYFTVTAFRPEKIARDPAVEPRRGDRLVLPDAPKRRGRVQNGTWVVSSAGEIGINVQPEAGGEMVTLKHGEWRSRMRRAHELAARAN